MAAKSNAVYTAYNAARAYIKADRTRPVPLRLRNAPTALMKGLDYGKGYRYAHDESGAYAAGETYLPEALQGQRFYEPTTHGLEQRIAERLAEWRRLDGVAQGCPVASLASSGRISTSKWPNRQSFDGT